MSTSTTATTTNVEEVKGEERLYCPTTKAYKNDAFLNSGHARFIRIMCEYEETLYRLKRYGVKSTILFFGSARAKSRDQYDAKFEELSATIANAVTEKEKEDGERQLATLKSTEWMVEYFDKIRELAKVLTEWSVESGHTLARTHSFTGVTRYHAQTRRGSKESLSVLPEDKDETEQCIYITTGGGPGFMEAANQGSSEVTNSRNIGMGITLPFEDGLNQYVSEELAFEFHYFFTRKFWMVYHCQALIVAPGGMGTFDELFEVLTLKQTGKVQKDLPVVLFGKDYWKNVINWQAIADYGVISQRDIDSLFFTDDVQEAKDFIVGALLKNDEEIQVEISDDELTENNVIQA